MATTGAVSFAGMCVGAVIASGFVVPNLPTFEDSTSALDAMGEAFAATLRASLAEKSRAFRFAPIDREAPVHRQGPLAHSAGPLAFARGVPTLGEIYRVAATGGGKRKGCAGRAMEVVIRRRRPLRSGPGLRRGAARR